MTTAAEPFTFAYAARLTIGLIGPAKAAALVGKSEETLTAWKHGTNPRWPRIDQALALDLAYIQAGGDGSPFLDSFQALVDQTHGIEACLEKLSAASAALAKDYGECAAATFEVMLPNASLCAKKRALVEVLEVMARLGVLKRLIKSFCLLGAGSRSQIAGGSQ